MAGGSPRIGHHGREVAVSFAEVLQDFFIGIGVDWILYLLVGLSVLSIAVILERWIFYTRRRVAPDLVHALSLGRPVQVFKDAMENRIAERIDDLRKTGVTREDAENAVETELRKHRNRYEQGLTFLATLGNNAPFIGLLGTVIGIMAAFFQLSDIAETTEKNELLMRSISEALIATAIGLLVALPAVMFYNIFRKRVNAAVEQAREIVTHRMRCAYGGEDGCGNE